MCVSQKKTTSPSFQPNPPPPVNVSLIALSNPSGPQTNTSVFPSGSGFPTTDSKNGRSILPFLPCQEAWGRLRLYTNSILSLLSLAMASSSSLHKISSSTLLPSRTRHFVGSREGGEERIARRTWKMGVMPLPAQIMTSLLTFRCLEFTEHSPGDK